MLIAGHVPHEFGLGLAVPIPKEHYSVSSSNYRCITVSPIISKIFELCLANKLQQYLHVSERQLGFKKKVGCSHAIYAVRKTVDYFVSNDSTVNVCTLDISKAFDRINRYCLLTKLLDRNMPKNYILLLHDWFCNVFIRVRWESVFSFCVKLESGVRQGGILSPVFFAIYINDVIVELTKSKLGCHVKGVYSGSWLYADDIILLAASLTQLQHMIEICVKLLDDIDLKVNAKKCKFTRIGKRFKSAVSQITINKSRVDVSNEIKYLGMSIVAGRIFKCNLHECKMKFFRSANGIFAKIGTQNVNVLLELIFRNCVPILSYGISALQLTKSELSKLDSCVNLVLSKVFGTFKTIVFSIVVIYLSVIWFCYTGHHF